MPRYSLYGWELVRSWVVAKLGLIVTSQNSSFTRVYSLKGRGGEAETLEMSVAMVLGTTFRLYAGFVVQ